MTPKFDKLLSEIADTPGINYGRERAAQYKQTPVVKRNVQKAFGDKGADFVRALKDVDSDMLKLINKERKVIQAMAKAGDKNVNNAKKQVADLQKRGAQVGKKPTGVS